MSITPAPKIVGPRDGKSGSLGSIGVRFIVDSEETHEAGFSLVEHPMPPRALAAPLHRHSREDEYSYVLEGRMGALLGDDVVLAEAGRPRPQAARPVAHVLATRVTSPAACSRSSPRRVRELLR